MGKVDGKVAFVTGAAMGNGLGATMVLAREGAKVALVDISDKVFETSKDLENKGYEVLPLIADVSQFDQVKRAVDRVIKKWNTIDILVNNAGVTKLVPFLEMSDEVRDNQFAVNIYGVWNCSKAVLPYMVKQKYGKVVNISSVTGPMVADVGESAYAFSKGGVLGFTKSLAVEFSPFNITVNAICPGFIHTPQIDQVALESNPKDPQSVIDGIGKGIPLYNRLGTIEEIGNVVAFLASDESSYITGTHIVLDGGATLPETSGTVGA